jgi:hypothetical protein
MASFDFNENAVTAPEHHIHESSEPLPGQRGAAPTTDYSVSTMERAPSSAADPSNVDNKNTSTDFARSGSTGSQTASNTERPMGVQPVSEGIFIFDANDLAVLIRLCRSGGVAVGGNESELPMGHAKFGDKVIGKTQKVSDLVRSSLLFV